MRIVIARKKRTKKGTPYIKEYKNITFYKQIKLMNVFMKARTITNAFITARNKNILLD